VVVTAARSGGLTPLALLVALALGVPGAAVAAEGALSLRAERPWFVPDHAQLQLAGDIGFLSPGMGYELAGRRVDLDLFLGWVPASIGGEDIYSVTGKITYAPWRLGAGPGWRVAPLRIAAQATYTFGSQYFVAAPGRYPSGYYEIPTALHTGVALGGAATRKLGGGEREIGLYGEIVALTEGLRAWRENPDVVDVSDVLSLALGTQVRF
jgi:hypothetical protein